MGKKTKKASAIPLERLLLDKGFRRNFELLQREKNRDEKLISALNEELLRNATANIRSKDSQSQKARKPRSKGDDGRTMSDLIKELARQHPDEFPRELWPHLESEIEKWAGECRSRNANGKPSYEYPSGSGAKDRRTLTYKHFCDLLRDVRESLKKSG